MVEDLKYVDVVEQDIINVPHTISGRPARLFTVQSWRALSDLQRVLNGESRVDDPIPNMEHEAPDLSDEVDNLIATVVHSEFAAEGAYQAERV